ncbi:O-antigen ligase family protein [Plectonema cf. radiosum LEGE 06105]|uniref:O-antigen ligase family protein n=1 Tax=Plectonema cf. radiosum LEGE 06105 TaxID=945769 RepID=A0A8J7K591_9CYAN|nr:O-antigen ligase family protein [Plectonema radiosum]MBE9215127.1 O-antigen ligase family protein [Plectonema cf. radiosum LEGE 06105]
MNQQTRLKPAYKKTTDCDGLFSGIWICWGELTQSEKIVCAYITLIPLWWMWGWRLYFVFLVAGIIIYELREKREIRLQRPSAAVIGIIGYGLYVLIVGYFYREAQGTRLNFNAVISPLNNIVCFGLLLWYVQDRKIRIRQQVVFWSFSIAIAMMLLMWGVIYFGLHQAHYIPPRSIYGLLTGKSGEYEPGDGNSNFLMPYFPTDESIGGLVRYVYFFPGPEALALVMGFVSLLSLDIKNRLWSFFLLFGSAFLLLTSGTRAVWVSLPIVLGLRYLFTTGKVFGPAFICGLLAIVSFSSLSVPIISNGVIDKITNTAEATANARADSTEVRGEIYRLTMEGIENAENSQLIFGHVVNGEGVLPGYEPAKVGTHSFILGTLLYRGGLLGTGFFLTFWFSLLWWLYQTRYDRPSCLFVFVLFSLTFATMELEMPVLPISLLCVMLRSYPVKNSSQRDITIFNYS